MRQKLYVNIASEQKDGIRAIGVVVKDNHGRTLEEFKEAVGSVTKNIADYTSLVRALEISAKYCREKVYVFTDNKLLVNHAFGSFRIRDRDLMKLLIEFKLLSGFFKVVRLFYVKKEVTR